MPLLQRQKRKPIATEYQLVLVRYPKGLKLDDIYTPLWVMGSLKVEKVSNDLADAAYALDASKVRVVVEEDL